MSDDFTPTRGEILSALVAYRAIPGHQTPAEIARAVPPADVAKFLAEAERGLAEIVRAAKEDAWDEGHTHCFHVGDPKQDETNPYRQKGALPASGLAGSETELNEGTDGEHQE